VSSRELLRTFEARAVRALREIDHALNPVTYLNRHEGGCALLPELRDKNLLPFFIGQLRRSPTAEAKLSFSRRLRRDDESKNFTARSSLGVIGRHL